MARSPRKTQPAFFANIDTLEGHTLSIRLEADTRPQAFVETAACIALGDPINSEKIHGFWIETAAEHVARVSR